VKREENGKQDSTAINRPLFIKTTGEERWKYDYLEGKKKI